MTALAYLSPLAAKQQQDDGALLVDIRQTDEYLREHIPRAHLYPLAERTTSQQSVTFSTNKPVIFYCLSGLRCQQYAEQLEALAPPQGAFMLEGGINAWKNQGLPVEQDQNSPLPLMRQVQIAAGGVIVTGVGLGYMINPAYFILAGAVGAGLVFAGISGFCGMAKLLMVMPWNRHHDMK